MKTLENSSLNGHKPTVAELEFQVPAVVTQRESRLPPSEEQDSKPPEKPSRSRWSKALIVTALGVGAILAGSFGYRWWQYASTHEDTDNATVAGHIDSVSSRINGTVLAVDVNDNQQVQQGQLLVELDPSDYKMQVLQAQAALQSAQRQANAAQTTIEQTDQNAQAQTAQAQGNISDALAGISAAQAAVNEARAGIPVAQAQVQQAKANLEKAKADYNRYSSLYSTGAVARQQLDNAKASYEVALAQRNSAEQVVQQAQAKLAQAQQGVSSAQAKLAQSRAGLQQASAAAVQTDVDRSKYGAAQAVIAQAEASLKDAQLQLSYTSITAAVAGQIGHKSVEVGQRVQSGTPLMAIVENNYWVTANFKETQLEEMKPGQMVEIKLDAFPKHTFTGKVQSISPASGSEFALLPPDNATGNFTKVVQRIPVKITFEPQSIRGYESRITPGMSAVVSVDLEENSD
ncbi:HlyD family efflux transporter periplasmic adaptor subunit [Lyngbya aestuarii]|uniref:HlyD family efflux transporter periplasmic adaptor subunit n=1 Tax=Lyngbya aestuarii TaxID=118322 RepID=UPI00403DA8D3